MPFSNRIRLPMQLHSAQFPEERNVFRKANGVTKTLSVVIRKQYELETDFLPELWHQRLKIALAHDNINWEGERYLGGVAQDGDYTIQWPDGVLHYPTAKAVSKVQVTPFDATNSNCQTCEEATQLSLADDNAGTLNEDTDYTVNTVANDTVCCYPAVFSLVSFNSDYLDTASINPATGVLSIHTGTGLTDANGLLIATYRVTCPNGGYDEADVYADINGSVAGCLAPTNLQVGAIGPTSLEFTWIEPFVGADYYWEIYAGTGPIGPPVQTGSLSITDNITVNALDQDTEYYFQIRTVCETANSNFIGLATSTIPESDICGSYNVYFYNGTGNTHASTIVYYNDCLGGTQTVVIYNQSATIICAQQNSPGNPTYIRGSGGSDGLIIAYLGLC